MRRVPDPLIALKTSLGEQVRALRGEPAATLPEPLLDLVVRRMALPGGDVLTVLPSDWEALRHEEGAAGRPVPYWARLWPSGLALAAALGTDPPAAGARVLELGCGLALPSIVAARAGADVLATDGSSDAVAFAAHGMAINGVVGGVGHAGWSEHAGALRALAPFDVVLAADVLYTRANAEEALRLLPQLLERGGVLRLADPGRAGARDFLAGARAGFTVRSVQDGAIALHTLHRR